MTDEQIPYKTEKPCNEPKTKENQTDGTTLCQNEAPSTFPDERVIGRLGGLFNRDRYPLFAIPDFLDI